MSDPDLSQLDPQARRFLAMVSLGAADATTLSADERRRSFDGLMRLSRPPAADIDNGDRSIPGCVGDIPVRVYAPRAARHPMPGLIYFHGGGLVAGSIDSHDALCRTLAHEAECGIVSVGYRLAPEHPFPAAILDALVAVRWIIRHATSFGLDRTAIAVAGDSGGATLATIGAQIFGARLRAQVLLCPVLDFAGAHESRRAFANGFLLDEATMARDLVHYAPNRPLGDRRVSPLQAPSLHGMPHTIIHTAGFDPLRDEGHAYKCRLEAAGVEVDYTCHTAMIHHFYALPAMIPAAGVALTAIAADIKRVLASSRLHGSMSLRGDS